MAYACDPPELLEPLSIPSIFYSVGKYFGQNGVGAFFLLKRLLRARKEKPELLTD